MYYVPTVKSVLKAFRAFLLKLKSSYEAITCRYSHIQMREHFPDAHPAIDTYLLNSCIILGEKKEKIWLGLGWDSN